MRVYKDKTLNSKPEGQKYNYSKHVCMAEQFTLSATFIKSICPTHNATEL